MSAGHAGDGCDMKLEIIHERKQVRSIGWLDSMHLKAAPFDGLIQEPIIISRYDQADELIIITTFL